MDGHFYLFYEYCHQMLPHFTMIFFDLLNSKELRNFVCYKALLFGRC